MVTDFRWVPLAALADFDGNGMLDAGDLDYLQNQLASGTNQLRFDFSRDAALSSADVASWLYDILGTLPGDANLDGTVDGADFLLWNQSKLQVTGRWTQGDFNFDGVTDGQDFAIWNQYKFQSASFGAMVPEPTAVTLWCCLGLWIWARRRVSMAPR